MPGLDNRADGKGLPASRGRTSRGYSIEKTHVRVNGVDQGMIITGTDTSDPVLLFIHGGPGMPGYFLTDRYPTGLENDFTVVWWDQRGAGLSYRPHIPVESMIVAQLVDDAIAVTDYLRRRFAVDRVYLLAHSWGSLVGIQAAAKAPDRYHAYVGMGQITRQIESEARSYAWMLDQYRARGDCRMVRRLEAAPVTGTPPLPPAYTRIRDKAMHTLGVGTTHDMASVVTGVFLPAWLCQAYTLRERLDIWRGRAFSRGTALATQELTTDVTAIVTSLQLPVYFLHGVFDHTVDYDMARGYLRHLCAPVKGFYTFTHSAHSPVYEEPERARAILRTDVLTGRATMADLDDSRTG
jgi:pimeloyl-ACP methyl ester carboxylesterase